jgi:hypothetical protein
MNEYRSIYCWSLLGLIFVLPSVFAQSVYPSTSPSWVLPGFHANSYDALDYDISGVDELVNWELTHADNALGSQYGAIAQGKINAVGYMYVQKIDFSPNEVEFALQSHAQQVGDNYEDYFLHFAENTVVQGANASHSSRTPFNRRPWIVGWTINQRHSGYTVWQQPPYSLTPWQYSAQGGCVYVYMPERFDRVTINLQTVATTGLLTVQYPSAIDANTGVVKVWSTIDKNMMDGTNHLRVTAGSVVWTPPADWVKAATYDVVNDTGQHFSNKYLKQGKRAYVVRLCRVGENQNDQPIVQDIQVKDWMPHLNNVNEKRVIYGWDERNDTNNDGYVDDTEFSNRTSANAFARFRYESRVTPLGNMWDVGSNYQRPDLLNPAYRTAIAHVMEQRWQAKSLKGAYNDTAFTLINVNVIAGGMLKEHSLLINDPDFVKQYQTAFIDTIKGIQSQTQSQWIAANISAENLFLVNDDRLNYLDAFDTFLREDYFRPGLGLAGYFGFSKVWDIFALAAQGKKSVVFTHGGGKGNVFFENTQSGWENSITAGLAMYYLINVPGSTSYVSWNKTYNYGSGNTTIDNFYKAGVPKNIAYQPTKMLEQDIGVPSGAIQTWPNNTTPQAIPYTASTSDGSYTVLGDSASELLQHGDIATHLVSGEVEVLPSNIYYAWQSDDTIVAGGGYYPQSMVLARDYDKGLVLYHTDFFGWSGDFNQVSRQIQLPGNYHRLMYDGSLSVASNTVTLTGYEGVVLVKADGVP